MRILIVEDEELAADLLKRRLKRILGPAITSLKIVRSQVAAACYIQEEPIDLLFLDLELQADQGFAILEEPAAKAFQTIIVSGKPDQALRAFEYSVLDFIAKPYSEERLAAAVQRFEDRSAWKFCPGSVPVPTGDAIHLMPLRDIFYIRRAGKNTMIHLADESRKIKKSLLDLEKGLPDSFCRIHRSHIINLKFLKRIEIRSGGCYSAILLNQRELSIGRTHYLHLKELLIPEKAGRIRGRPARSQTVDLKGRPQPLISENQYSSASTR